MRISFKGIGKALLVVVILCSFVINALTLQSLGDVFRNQAVLAQNQKLTNECLRDVAIRVQELNRQDNAKQAQIRTIMEAIASLEVNTKTKEEVLAVLQTELNALTAKVEGIKVPEKLSCEYLKDVTVIVLGEIKPDSVNSNVEELEGEGDLGWCGTGVIVKITDDFTYVLTNRHVAGGYDAKEYSLLKVMGDVYTEAYDAEIVKIAEVADLALIKVAGKIPGKQAIKGVKFPTKAQPAYTIGHHLGRPFIYGEGVYSGVSGVKDVYQLPCMWGCSGSGIFDNDGYLTGMVYSGEFQVLGGYERVWDVAHVNAVPAIYIQNFLKGVVDVESK